jgi:hypothetical protein
MQRGKPANAIAADMARTQDAVGWDPYEVWRTRVLLPRLSQSQDRPPPPAATVRAQAGAALDRRSSKAALSPAIDVVARREADVRRVSLPRQPVQPRPGASLARPPIHGPRARMTNGDIYGSWAARIIISVALVVIRHRAS